MEDSTYHPVLSFGVTEHCSQFIGKESLLTENFDVDGGSEVGENTTNRREFVRWIKEEPLLQIQHNSVSSLQVRPDIESRR